MNEIDAELRCDYCLKKSRNPQGWCKIDKVGITVCPNCLLGHWGELKEAFVNDKLNTKYFD